MTVSVSRREIVSSLTCSRYAPPRRAWPPARGRELAQCDDTATQREGKRAERRTRWARRPGDLIGISTWDETLLAAVESMRPARAPGAARVVQLTGGAGDPQGRVRATRLTAGLAEVTGATPLFVRAPGVVGSTEARLSLLNDPAVREISQAWQRLTAVLVGIGSLEPSPLLRLSGNAVTEEDIARRCVAAGSPPSSPASPRPAACSTGREP
ncbi:sugar-binding domain-containing protein [Streptomyces hainanensis]|uniref:Sugar-binding domain-containing protein n=1 Tax=Streptomyces hainanensis TaxID=402648 RepID=A0A4R4SVW8_9ACTN|nr:sugar-binding domain-containing protein [Streptomyces hainanensis]TDC68287.1 hypothetical protein E1283_27605 [Streptomyces hainanensis]